MQSMWVITTWQHISPEVIMKGYFKCCISNAMDGTNEDTLWNGNKQDGIVMCQCDEVEGTDYAVTLIGKGTQNMTCFVY